MAEAEVKKLVQSETRRRHYETVFVVSPSVSDANAKELVEKMAQTVSQYKGTILRRDDWGKKRLPFPMGKHAMGHYIYFRFIGTQEVLKELERSLKLEAHILRYISVQLSEKPLSETEVQDLIAAAPKEPTYAPSLRPEEDDYDSSAA